MSSVLAACRCRKRAENPGVHAVALGAEQSTSSSSSAGESKAGPVIGYVDGCFDLMHSGHYNAIRQAKMLCDKLVVGVHSDDEITLSKAKPVMNQAERYGLLEHLKWADELVYDVPYSPSIATLDRCGADFCVHGDDMPVKT